MIYDFEKFNESRKDLKYVYHILDRNKLEYVLKNNSIDSYHFSNVSTTRNPRMSHYVGDDVTSWFKLELDFQKLNQKYKSRKFVYVSQTKVRMPEEQEQQFLTQSISPAFDYITRVILIKSRLESSMRNLDNEPSDWITDAPFPEEKIPQIIAKFKKQLEDLKIPFEVQDYDGKIRREDAYIDHVIKIPIQHVELFYAYVYRKNKRIQRWERMDVIYDPILKKEHRAVVGEDYPIKDFICMEDSYKKLDQKYKFEDKIEEPIKASVEEIKDAERNSKIHKDKIDLWLPKDTSELYVATFRKEHGKYHLDDFIPHSWVVRNGNDYR